MKTALRKGGPKDLNVYSAKPTELGVLGWSTQPFAYDASPKLDGIVIHHSTIPGSIINLGTCAGVCNKGKTLVHEVGHWLGLQHTFRGGCQASSTAGDGVPDTPAEAIESQYCAVRDTCTGQGFEGLDPVRNYMDYSPDDWYVPLRGTVVRGPTLRSLPPQRLVHKFGSCGVAPELESALNLSMHVRFHPA